MLGRKRRHRRALERIEQLEVAMGLREPPPAKNWAAMVNRQGAAYWKALAERKAANYSQ